MGEFNQAKYIQEYQKEKYDRCVFNVPKGQKAVLKEHWTKKGYDSLNAYVNDLIQKDMEQHGQHTEQGGVFVMWKIQIRQNYQKTKATGSTIFRQYRR